MNHDPATVPPEVCGWCGLPLDEDTLVLATVADSSVIHPGDPARDGRRLILACGQEHLAALRERYESRPFRPVEQWAGKVARELAADGGLSSADLAERTGLTLAHVEAALFYRTQQSLRHHVELHGQPRRLSESE